MINVSANPKKSKPTQNRFTHSYSAFPNVSHVFETIFKSNVCLRTCLSPNIKCADQHLIYKIIPTPSPTFVNTPYIQVFTKGKSCIYSTKNEYNRVYIRTTRSGRLGDVRRTAHRPHPPQLWPFITRNASSAPFHFSWPWLDELAHYCQEVLPGI